MSSLFNTAAAIFALLAALAVAQSVPPCKSSVFVLSLLENGGNAAAKVDSVKEFIKGCTNRRRGSFRELIQFITPPYNGTSTCTRGPNSNCASIPLDVEKLTLRANQTFEIRANVGPIIFLDPCHTGALVVVLSDIPCSQYDAYADLREMFDKELKAVVGNLTLFKVNAIFVWLGDQKGENMPCKGVKDYHDSPPSNSYFHVEYMTLKELEKDGALCDVNYRRSG